MFPGDFSAGAWELRHVPDVFWNPQFLAHVLAGVQFALGDLEAENGPDRR